MKLKKIICALVLSIIMTVPSLAMGQWKGGTSSGTNTPNIGGGGYNEAQGSDLPDSSIYGIILGIMNWLLIMIGIFGVIGFVIAGIFYLTAAGNEDQMKKGKDSMTWSIIGVIVGLMGYVIIQAVDKMLNATPEF